ncbi:MarC family protein [Polycladidibacter stylochi]|uniref:MarC family protein n=1 Tax=Polycladidibacter stylochi TaxID=1807766 RepID=UPI0008338F0F|nr:MarC family protein [Pseudovibrio stylochi]
MDYAEAAKAFGSLFAIMNPFVNLPIFMSLTSDLTQSQQRFLAAKIALYSAGLATVILFSGRELLVFFGITVEDFRIAGGLVLGNIAWSMLNGREVASHMGSVKEQSSLAELTRLAFYPMTFPIIVGPGTLATLIIYTGFIDSAANALGLLFIIYLILAIVFIVFYFSSHFSKVFSSSMRVIITRLMGMVLLAIAVDMLTTGLTAMFPNLVN